MSEISHHLAFTQNDITALAHRILDLDPDPAPRFLVLRDLLGCPSGDPAVQEAERKLLESRWVRELAAAQQPDGTWGRFHSQDSRVKTPFPTSEFAIRRALALGLDGRSPILQNAAGFIQAHIEGKAIWSDSSEKQDDPRVFPYNIRSVSAAMLALIDPCHPLLEPFWQHWAGLVEAAFAGGSYDPQAELARHQALSGIPSRRLMAFHRYYPLLILSATRWRLPAGLERKILAFLLHKPDGIYYVCERSLDDLPGLEDPKFFTWLHGQQVLARFEGWKEFAPRILNWLWSLRGAAGLWEPGSAAGRSYDLPLSETWRRKDNRMIDCSLIVLGLIQRYFR